MSGERQYPETWADARRDHQQRYEWANQYLYGRVVLDIFCGAGYGSWYLADQDPLLNVLGFDGSQEALDWAREHFIIPGRTSFHPYTWPGGILGAGISNIVSLESVEHVQDGQAFINDLASWLQEGGMLIFSTPNNDQLPFLSGRWPWHFRHYSLTEALELATNAGLKIISWAGQDVYKLNRDSKVVGLLDPPIIKHRSPGQFTLIAARKL